MGKGTGWTAMSEHTDTPRLVTDETGDLPLFQGFDASDLTGRDLAGILGVSAPTVSKWRHGKARMPASKLAFMTLLLASRTEDMERSLRENLKAAPDATPADPAAVQRSNLGMAIATLRRCLRLQEQINHGLSPAAVREGSRQFRAWWENDGQVRRRTDAA